MAYETIQVKPATVAIGAEVSGIDLSRPLGNQQFQEVHDALMAHQVLFFRDQKLTLDQHKAFGRLFGELAIHPNTPGPEGHPEILPVHADANSKRIAGERWHSDVSCDPEPPMGSILNLKIVPPVGGDTIFASMYAAYDALSPGMKTYLSGLTAIHDGSMNYGRTNRLIGADGPKIVSARGASGDSHASGDRAAGDLRQSGVHHGDQGRAGKREPGDPGVPV